MDKRTADGVSPRHDVNAAGDSFFGLSDMAGGVWEFVLDSFGGYTGAPTSFVLDPVYLEAERDHIVRGGAWRSMLATEMLSWGRTVTGSPSNVIVGFRCARAPR